VAHQVDAAVQLVEASGGEAEIDLVWADARIEELPPCHDPVLPACKRRNYTVRESSERPTGYMPVNPALDRVAPVVA
jgi:hypothetical protein